MLDTDNEVFDWGTGKMMEIPTEYIEEYVVKHSFNIIDLIEVGDYVNGSRVEQTYLDGSRKYIKLENRDKTKVFENRIYSKDIKTIVTKEQFENCEYKVGE